MHRYTAIALPVLWLASTAATPSPSAPDAALAATAGTWRGELQYRDYQSDSWQGLPVSVVIAAQPDGVTTVRTAQYDDGPQTGIVTITTVTIVDAKAGTAGYAIARRGRAMDTGTARIVSFLPGRDSTHWTFVTVEHRKDGNELAQVRETTERDGDTMTTTKEVDADGDGVDRWLPRNRTVLRRARP